MSASRQPLPETVPQPPGLAPVPAPPEPRRRRWMFGVIALGLGVALLGAYLLRPRPQQAPQAGFGAGIRTVKAAVGSLLRTVRVGGVSSARNFALMSIPVFRGPDSRANLTLMKLAKGGTFVKKGEIVAVMDAQNLQDHIDDVRDSVEQSEQDILKRKAEQAVDWGNLQQTITIARGSLDKATLEDRAGEVKTDVERELLRLNLEEAQATYKQRQADLTPTRDGDRAEVRILEIAKQKNQIHLDRHLVDIVKFEMKAPMPGLVVMQQVFRGGEMAQIQAGDQVSPGQPVMKIVDTASMQVEATINQSESSELRIGQTATVGLDAFPELRFKGRIYSIGALAVSSSRRENYYLRSVPICVTIEGTDSRLIPDLSAWADVEIERRDNVLLVPREAVRSEDGQATVYVKGARQFEPRAVTLGLSNQTQVAVLEGLQPGEEVALSRPR
jgi:biotin carboxyl carrier protein